MGKNKSEKRKASELDDWISSLAKQSAASNSTTTNNVPTLSKEERKQKRAAKKARRQQQLEEQKRPRREVEKSQNQKSKFKVDQSKRRLKLLAEILMALQEEHENSHRPFQPSEVVPKKKKRPLNEENIQPKPSDYSGIGLARDSLFLSFLDPSHIPKLEEEFHEHIPGFFGKQRTKAMKRQLDGDMLWRKLAQQKEKGVVPKKFAQLSPDDRVQAMIDAGMI